MITALRSTVTARVIGTVMYMAPEVLIKKEPATVFSDVWSVTCTLLELYSEELVWDVSDQKELEEKLENEAVPDLTCVPDDMRDVLLKCFSNVATDRPLVTDIYKILND